MTTRELIDKYGILANKSLGQNFLHRDDIIDLIADTAAGKTDTALEIGAGLGVLSHALCSRFKKVTTVEIDKSLSAVTNHTLKDDANHTMVYADFLRVDFDSLTDAPTTVVGNLPYYITGDILKKLFKNHKKIERAVVMIQKEAADKLLADPCDKRYRAISVAAQYFCDITKVCDVSPDCFIPAPHVFSTVLMLDFKKKLPVPDAHEREFFEFVNRVFSARRKKLTAVFNDAEQKKNIEAELENLGFLPSARGETLSPLQLAHIFNKIL